MTISTQVLEVSLCCQYLFRSKDLKFVLSTQLLCFFKDLTDTLHVSKLKFCISQTYVCIEMALVDTKNLLIYLLGTFQASLPFKAKSIVESHQYLKTVFPELVFFRLNNHLINGL